MAAAMSAGTVPAEGTITRADPDPLTVTSAPPLAELVGVLRPFSKDRQLLRKLHHRLEQFEPSAPGYVYWHLARIVRTFGFVRSIVGGREWVDISSDPWFCLLADLELKPRRIVPTSMREELIEFRDRKSLSAYRYAPSRLTLGGGPAELARLPQAEVVTAFEVLEHIPEHPASFFALASSVLPTGGSFVLSTPNICGWTKIRRLLDGSGPYDTRQFGGPMCHRKEYTPWEVRRLCESAGFEVVRTVTCNPYLSDRKRISDWLLKVACTIHAAGTANLIRLRNLLLLSGSTMLVHAVKRADCRIEEIARC